MINEKDLIVGNTLYFVYGKNEVYPHVILDGAYIRMGCVRYRGETGLREVGPIDKCFTKLPKQGDDLIQKEIAKHKAAIARLEKKLAK